MKFLLISESKFVNHLKIILQTVDLKIQTDQGNYPLKLLNFMIEFVKKSVYLK